MGMLAVTNAASFAALDNPKVTVEDVTDVDDVLTVDAGISAVSGRRAR